MNMIPPDVWSMNMFVVALTLNSLNICEGVVTDFVSSNQPPHQLQLRRLLRLLLITVLASGLLMATLAHYYIQDDSVEMTTRQFLYDTWIAR